MRLKVEIEQEEDGRGIAEIGDLPGVMAYGTTPDEAKAKVQALALNAFTIGGHPASSNWEMGRR